MKKGGEGLGYPFSRNGVHKTKGIAKARREGKELIKNLDSREKLETKKGMHFAPY